ncbi:1-(5-phosphoribosyl)-5-[(5-phosphoribosylamino)me thylideneamino]imidazole-4-carboxamide isomerase [Candidatus Kapaibacterium sp.]
MLVIPSFEIENGKCCRCIIGLDNTDKIYHNLQKNPQELIKLLRKENFKSIHIIDRDSIFGNSSFDFELISLITKSTDVPVQIHTKIESFETCTMVFDAGVFRLIIEVDKIPDIELAKVIEVYTANSICGFVTLNALSEEYLEKYSKYGIKRIVLGTENYNIRQFDFSIIDKINKISSFFKFTLYGGINNSQDLLRLNKIKSSIDSVIIGNPLFENNFPCQKIWRKIEAELE